MNRKGEQDTSGPGILVPMIIAAVVIVLVFLFIINADFRNKISSIIPDFAQPDGIEDKEFIVRYSLSDGNVEYYTGVEWRALDSGGLNVNGKKLEGESLIEDFESYYYDSPRIESEIGFSSNVASNFYPNNPSIGLVYGLVLKPIRGDPNEDYGRTYLDIILKSVDRTNQAPQGSFILELDNSLWFMSKGGSGYSELNPVSYTSDHITLINSAKEIRDSIFNMPIEITFQDESLETSCVEKIIRNDKSYLVTRIGLENEESCDVA